MDDSINTPAKVKLMWEQFLISYVAKKRTVSIAQIMSYKNTDAMYMTHVVVHYPRDNKTNHALASCMANALIAKHRMDAFSIGYCIGVLHEIK